MTSRLLIAFHGSGPNWSANGEAVRKQFHLDELAREMGFDLLTPDSPRGNSPLGSAWPVDESLDEKMIVATEGYKHVALLGYSSGGFFAAGLALRRAHALGEEDLSVAIVAGGVLARDAWHARGGVDIDSVPWLFVHGPHDPVVNWNGGAMPVSKGGKRFEGYLGPKQALDLINGTDQFDSEEPFDLIDPSEDGWLEQWLARDTFDGAETTRCKYANWDELWRIEPKRRDYMHTDYLGRAASRHIVKWLFGDE